MRRIGVRATLLLAGAAVLLWVVPATVGQPNERSEQVIFSVANVSPAFNYTAPTPPPNDTHFGFWIWCEGPVSINNYAGQCSGSMYFYGLGVTRPVSGLVSGSSGIFTMRVASPDGEIACGLANQSPNTGAGAQSNTIDVTCPLSPQAPGVIQGTATADYVIVNVTVQ